MPTGGRSTDVDLRDLLPFFQQGRAAGSFDLGIQKALERMLVSSQFLFRIERPGRAGLRPARARPYPISDLELASRLSFFLWSSIPDDELLDAAIAGRLKQPAVLERQVRRMLADRRSSALVTNFAAQWLYLRDIEAKLPDEVLFQDFDETLRAAMERETELFVDSVFRENRSVLDLLDRQLHVPERAAGEALRHPERARQLLPPRHAARGQPARRPAGPRQRADDHVVLHAHVAGAARQVGAREPAVGGRRRRRPPTSRRSKPRARHRASC